MIDPKAQTEFNKSLIGKSQIQRDFFTPGVVDLIGDEFTIHHKDRDEIGLLLEIGANAYLREARLEALDFERVRKDLGSLEKAAKSLTTIMDNLAPDALEILVRVGFVQRLQDMPLPRITQSETSPVLDYTDRATDLSRRIPLSEARTIVTALGQCADYALEKVNDSRKGRPEKGALVDLLHFGFHVWATRLGRAFTLDWASDGEPISKAAMFSVRIVRVVDPAATLQQISTAARKVREKGMPIRDLEEVPQVLEHYRKQYE